MSDVLAPATPPQVQAVTGETEGFKAKGGALRGSIRDRIAAARPYTSKIVTIPEWDSEIEVRSLSLGERNEMLGKLAEDEGGSNIKLIYPEVIIRCTFDPDTGERVFAEDDVAFIESRPANLMDRLAMPAMELSGMGDTAVDDEAKKSSETEPSESASPSPNEQGEPSPN